MKFLDEAKTPADLYPELRDVLEIFVDSIMRNLRDNLVGINFVSSIASGDSDLDSDVNFLVVTNSGLTESDMKVLQGIQIKIYDLDNSLLVEHLR